MIDYTKLKAAIHEAEAYIKGKTPLPNGTCPVKVAPGARATPEQSAVISAWYRDELPKQYTAYWRERATRLYALTAHSRGRLHIRRQRLSGDEHGLWAMRGGTGPTPIVERDAAWQERLIADIAPEFAREEALAQAVG